MGEDGLPHQACALALAPVSPGASVPTCMQTRQGTQGVEPTVATSFCTLPFSVMLGGG